LNSFSHNKQVLTPLHPHSCDLSIYNIISYNNYYKTFLLIFIKSLIIKNCIHLSINLLLLNVFGKIIILLSDMSQKIVYKCIQIYLLLYVLLKQQMSCYN